jgi:hypothetical protein
MTRPLRIRDWERLYETSETRKLKSLAWVKVPNRMDSEGYCFLTNHPNGAGHLGVWIAMLEIASACHPRGTLLRNLGGGHTPDTLALKCRLPVELIEEAIPRLLEIRWLELATVSSPDAPGDSPDEIPEHREISGTPLGIDKRRLDEIRPEEKSARASSVSESGDETPSRLGLGKFDEFFAAYPKRIKQAAARHAYQAAITTDAEHARLLAGLQCWLASDQWVRSMKEDGARFVPAPDRFISEKLYAEEPTPYAGESAGRRGGSTMDARMRAFIDKDKTKEQHNGQ